MSQCKSGKCKPQVDPMWGASFFDSWHCASKHHCQACRTSRKFRESIAKVYNMPDAGFACPEEPIVTVKDERPA